MKTNSRQVLLIGDGLSDCCVAAEAGFVLAKEGQTLHQACQKHHYPHRTFTDFYDVRALLDPASGSSPICGHVLSPSSEGSSLHAH